MTDRLPSRFHIIGSSGSGKTTFARRLAERLGLPHVELDALHLGPDWTPVDREVFAQRVRDATEGDGWVCDGNYSAVRPMIIERADVVVWLDLPLRTCLRRVIRRTIRRIRHREELWHGNRETWRSLVGGDSLLWWVITQHRRKRRDYAALLEGPQARHLTVHRFATSHEANRWLNGLRGRHI